MNLSILDGKSRLIAYVPSVPSVYRSYTSSAFTHRVTGPTGAGKTTVSGDDGEIINILTVLVTQFINRVCGSDFRVGTGLLSCTDHVQIAECVLAHQMVTLIDTPGFDDTYKSQADILNDIASFLERT